MASKTKGMLVLFSGPSGSGKDTVLAELKTRDINLKQSISMTTRAMRDGEADGVDYYFTDVATFEKNIEEGYFLEYVKYGENYYGTPLKEIEEAMEKGKDIILEIEVDGGINKENAQYCKIKGANAFVAGSYVFSSEDMKEAIASLR